LSHPGQGEDREGVQARSNTKALVDALVHAAPRFSPADRRGKRRLLVCLEVTPIGQPETLRRYHEALCFLQAYPDDPEILALVDRVLAHWDRRIRRLSRWARARLHDSGIAGTVVTYPFGFAMARWLAPRDPREVRVVWGGAEEGERLEETLSVLVTRVEGEAFTEGGPGWRRWLEVAARGRALSALQLLIELFERAPIGGPTRDWLYESLDLTLEWRLPPGGPSRTHARLPAAPRCFHGHGGMPSGPAAPRTRRHLLRLVRQPVRLRPASPALAAALIEAARVAMATRARELYAFSYPNPWDVLVADLEQGLRVALIGLPPDLRLPLDAYYAFLVLKNGVPVSYGAGWYLFGTLEVGFNVFESFRHGESAFIASQVFRIYQHVFPVRAVVVDRYQIGYDNDEALRSGAFYFYQRLGFHPVEAATRRLARAEQERIAGRAGYRSPPAVLRQLAQGDLVLTLGRGPAPARVRAGALAARVSAHVTRRHAGDRAAAVRAATRRLAAAVGPKALPRWQGAERSAFETFALLLDLVPDLEDWTANDLRALLPLVQSKAGASERDYARLMDRHRRLRAALADAARGSDR
jgi:hypothetical protein